MTIDSDEFGLPGFGREGHQMIRAILFDLDETLIDRAETMRRFLGTQHRQFQELWRCTNEDFVNTCLKHQDNGYADKLDAYRSACEKLGFTDAGLATKLFSDFKDRYGQDPVPFPGVTETLSHLQARYRLGLVSNGRTRGQMAKIEACNIKRFFSSICISESVGCKKPDEAIFRECLDELSVQPAEAVFVGDNPVVDIEPAIRLGMLAFWVKNPHFPEPLVCDGIITCVSEIPDMLLNFT